MAAEQIEVSVIICVRNGAATIRRQLEALDAQRDPPPFEVIIVDNGSTDGTPAIARAWINAEGHQHVRASLVDAGRRPGIPRARNIGAGAATGRLLAFCDSDDVVGPDWVAAFSAAVRVDGLAGGRILAVHADGTPKPEVFGAGLIGTSYLPHVSNCNCAITRNLFNAVGGYDESLPRYGFEDVDLSWRVQESGFPLLYVDDAVVHFTLSSNAASIRKRFRLGQGRVLMARRFPEYDPQQYTVRSTAADLVGDAAQLVKTALRTHRCDRQGASRLVAGAGRVVGAIRYAGSRTPPRRLLEPVVSKPQMLLAANNGEIGGGEVMLLNIAEALRDLGMYVVVLGPRHPGELVAEASSRGFAVEVLPARNRLQWMLALRTWRRLNPRLPLWCNGLVPAAATALLGPRLVHLHIIPTGRHAALAALARIGARRTIVISRFMASRVAGRTHVLENWTEEIPFSPHPIPTNGEVRIGFLGRLTLDKGVDVLAEALNALDLEPGKSARLVLAGENRFGSSEDDRIITRALAPLGDSVEKLGWVSREEFFSSVDIAVFPSTWDEPFGLVAAEAMASGTPFIISDAEGLVEVAGDEYPWVARRGDPTDLARVLAQVISTPAEETASVVRRGRRRWEEQFSSVSGRERVAHLLIDVVEKETR